MEHAARAKRIKKATKTADWTSVDKDEIQSVIDEIDEESRDHTKAEFKHFSKQNQDQGVVAAYLAEVGRTHATYQSAIDYVDVEQATLRDESLVDTDNVKMAADFLLEATVCFHSMLEDPEWLGTGAIRSLTARSRAANDRVRSRMGIACPGLGVSVVPLIAQTPCNAVRGERCQNLALRQHGIEPVRRHDWPMSMRHALCEFKPNAIGKLVFRRESADSYRKPSRSDHWARVALLAFQGHRLHRISQDLIQGLTTNKLVTAAGFDGNEVGGMSSLLAELFPTWAVNDFARRSFVEAELLGPDEVLVEDGHFGHRAGR